MAVSILIENEFPKEEIKKILDEIRRPIEVAVWGSKNYFNFGNIIRTSHNFLVSKLWGIDLQKDPENPISKPYYKKAAMTTEKWERDNICFVNLKQFLEQTIDRNIVAFERRENLNSKDIRTFKYPENPILLFGSENDGIPSHLMKRANFVVSIPCDGFCLDLNLGVAAGIVLYDWLLKDTMKDKFK